MPFIIDDEISNDNSQSEFAPKTGNFTIEEPEISSLEKIKGYAKEGLRHGTRIGSRVGETVIGFPGDIVNFSKYISEKLPDSPEALKEKEPNFVKRAGRRALEWLPTSSELKDMSSYLTSGFTDPQGVMEEFGDEVASMATSLLIPSKDPTKFKSFLKALGTATAAKGSSGTLKALGAGETAQNTAEIGTLLLTGLMGKKTADAFVADKYKTARGKIPAGTMVNTNKFAGELSRLEQELAKGVSTNTKDAVKSATAELRAKASGGAMPMDEIVESYHNINERLSSKKLFDELNTTERKALKHRYDKLKDIIRGQISEYGKSNPDFFNEWTEANAAFKTIADSKKVSNFLQSKLGRIPKYLSGSLAYELFTGHPVAAAGLAGAAAPVKMGELLYRISKDPSLRKHYLNVIKEAGNENLPAVIKSLSAIHNKNLDLNESVV